MENRQIRTLSALNRALAFFKRHPITPEPPLLAGMRKSLGASAERIHDLAGTQEYARRTQGAQVDAHRRKLRHERLMPLVRIARPVLAFAPGAEKALRVPHARDDARAVAAAALRLADFLQPHAKLLRSAGCSKEFLSELRHEARSLALSAKTAAQGRRERAAATAGIAAEFRKVQKTLTILEGLVMLHFATQPALIAEWRGDRRVSKRLGRPPKRKGRDGNEMTA